MAFPNIHPTKYVWKISLNSTLDQDLPLENYVSQKSKDDLQGIMCLINIESIFWKDKKTLFNWNYLTRKGIFYWYTSRGNFNQKCQFLILFSSKCANFFQKKGQILPIFSKNFSKNLWYIIQFSDWSFTKETIQRKFRRK